MVDHADNPWLRQRGLVQDERTPGVDVSASEAAYAELVADTLLKGLDGPEEAAAWHRAREMLGLSQDESQAIERALRAGLAEQARLSVDVRAPVEARRPKSEPPTTEDAEHTSVIPLATPQSDPVVAALEARIAWLESQNQSLTHEVEMLQAQLDRPSGELEAFVPLEKRDPTAAYAKLADAPQDAAALRDLLGTLKRDEDRDQRVRVAHALELLGALDTSDAAATELGEVVMGPPQLKVCVSSQTWANHLRDPEETRLPGEVFAVVARALLLAQIAAIRGVARLPQLGSEGRIDPEHTEVSSARCVPWAATVLGIEVPPVYVAPQHAGGIEIVPGGPSALRLCDGALDPARTPAELAFMVGRHLCSHRPDHFVATLVMSGRELDDLFLAALLIAKPDLPLDPKRHKRVLPVVESIQPLLPNAARPRLEELLLQFIEQGGRVNLRRWDRGRDRTATTAGLLLSGSLRAATAMLQREDADRAPQRIADAFAIWTSPRFGRLRRAVGAEF